MFFWCWVCYLFCIGVFFLQSRRVACFFRFRFSKSFRHFVDSMTGWAILLRLLDNMLLILSMFSLAVDYSWFDWLRSDILRIARLVLINIASWLRTRRLKGLRRSNFLFPWWIASASTLWLSWRYIIFAFENGFWILLSMPSVWAFLTWLYFFV